MPEPTVLIQYDKYVDDWPNSWGVMINGEIQFFPFSWCDLDEESKCVLCPEWLAIEKQLEDYILE